VLDAAWQGDGRIAGRLHVGLPSGQVANDAPTLTAPRLTELCFQTAGVWEIGTTGQMALPLHLERVVPATTAEPAGGATAIVEPVDDGFSAIVVDDDGTALLRLEGYRTVPLPGTLDEALVAPLRAAMGDGG
jgi:hypothetical protein